MATDIGDNSLKYCHQHHRTQDYRPGDENDISDWLENWLDDWAKRDYKSKSTFLD